MSADGRTWVIVEQVPYVPYSPPHKCELPKWWDKKTATSYKEPHRVIVAADIGTVVRCHVCDAHWMLKEIREGFSCFWVKVAWVDTHHATGVDSGYWTVLRRPWWQLCARYVDRGGLG